MNSSKEEELGSGVQHVRLVMVPQDKVNPFYEEVREGCEFQAKKLSSESIHVECLFLGPDLVDRDEQNRIVRDLIANNTTKNISTPPQWRIHGLAMAVSIKELAVQWAEEAFQANLPFFTFDSDAPESRRLMYIGTDNYGFGKSLAKVLLQIQSSKDDQQQQQQQQQEPQSSNRRRQYAIVVADSPNLKLRADGIRSRLQAEDWVEVESSPLNAQGNSTYAIELMKQVAATGTVDAILPVGAWPMRVDPIRLYQDYVEQYPLVWNVVADKDPAQVEMLDRGYVDGLVGQMPFQMGTTTIEKLYQVVTACHDNMYPFDDVTTCDLRQFQKGDTFFETSVVEVIRVPQTLKDLQVDMRYLGNWIYFGFVLFGIVALLALGFILWTLQNRTKPIIKAAQPGFLIVVAVGVLVMASSIIPMSFDDGWVSAEAASSACMVTPWLLSLGFSTCFSALLSKTWRTNQIFRRGSTFQRVKVTPRDALLPFVILVGLNILIVTLFTVLAPLEYKRQNEKGTDDWNRVIATYGFCTSTEGNSLAFGITLVTINVGVLILANYQAYQARSIQSQFSESRYIGLIMASLLQIFLVGLPMLLLLNGQGFPLAQYVVKVLIVFVTCLSVLLWLFVPKVSIAHFYSAEAEEQRAKTSRHKRIPDSAFIETSRKRPSKGSDKHSSKVLSKCYEVEKPQISDGDMARATGPASLRADCNAETMDQGSGMH
jgi:ABC-type sugar transport system substrate-binding protein